MLVYTALTASMVAAPAMTATAETNPATSAGQTAINAQNASTAAASAGGAGNTTNAPQPINNGSIQEAVEVCPLQEASEQAMAQAMEVIKIVPDVDELFNNKTEAAQGCFAASSKVMNLALEIPSFDGFNSAAAQLIKRNISNMIQQKQQEFLSMGCEIADQALLSALSPVQDYLTAYNTKVGTFNGLLGNLDMGAGYENTTSGGFYGNLSSSIGSTIDQAQNRIQTDGQNMQQSADSLAAQYRNVLNNATPISGGTTSGATTSRTVAPTTTTSSTPAYTAPPTTTQPTTNTTVPSTSTTQSSSANPYGSAPQTQSATNPF